MSVLADIYGPGKDRHSPPVSVLPRADPWQLDGDGKSM